MNADPSIRDRANAVAIIGMACRLPGATDVDAFWTNLLGGVDSLTTFSDEELLAAGVPPEQIRSPNYVRRRGIINGADEFDAGFFGFTPRDAELVDPQQRVFLECAWHALEDGGYVPGRTDARIGVFGGIGTNWHLGEVNQHPTARKYASAASVVTSNDKDYATTRVSYKLNLTGPSVNVQCACSTSLVAALMGAASLNSYQCDLVLVGGATIQTPERKGYLYQEGGMESPDGYCRPFDAKAKGTVFSRGCGVLLLKRLADAVADGDHIYALLLDGAINNDGSEKVGFTAPSIKGQVEVGIEALERAGVDPRSLTFVEAHGTATALGDPIEVTSLAKVFSTYTDVRQFCALGSVKGNIGHTDVAAGAASLIKSALALEQRVLPASLYFDAPNPEIDFARGPFFVNTARRDLSGTSGPLRALVNAFGVGGTNATAILEEPPRPAPRGPGRRDNLFVFSAKSEAALEAMTRKAADHLRAHAELDLDDVAFTLQVGRGEFAHRRFVVAAGREELLDRLTGRKRGLRTASAARDAAPSVVFAFPGQGNQYLGMGRDLYAAEPVYREAIDRIAEALRPVLDLDLRDVIYAPEAVRAEAVSRLNETDVTQPAIFATSYAQARLLMSWGVKPDALVGHSVGEYVAAAVAGVMAAEDAAVAVARRGQLIYALPRGSMLAVLVPEAALLPLLPAGVSVGAVNSPQLTVASGPTAAIQALEAALKERGVFAKHLDTSHAFHSPMVDGALAPFGAVLRGVPLKAPSIPIVSTVTGRWLTAAEATDPDYWVQHMRRPVRFADAAATLFGGKEARLMVECGPGHSLASAAKVHLAPASPHAVVGTMRADGEEGSDGEHVLSALGAIWAAGRRIEWVSLYGARRPQRVSLPGYPFERSRFALPQVAPADAAAPAKERKNPDLGQWFYQPAWRRTPSADLLAGGAAADPAAPPEVWLVLEDSAGVGAAMRRLLGRAGQPMISVRPGEAYRADDTLTFTVRPGVAEDLHEVMRTVRRSGRVPNRVVHLWNVGAPTAPLDLASLAEQEGLAFHTVLQLEQALIADGLGDDVRLLVGASGAFDVAGEGIADPARALAIGPARVFGRETPGAQGRFVDVELPRTERGRERLAGSLISEARLRAPDTAVAYRSGYRWAESFEPVRLPEAGLAAHLRPGGGVYLVTGGLGGLGLFVAGQIAAAGPAVLALTHLSAMPPREEWDGWLKEKPAKDVVSERIRGVRDLEAAGATVLLFQADVADLDAMQAVVESVTREHGAFTGIIHAAGIVGGGIISLKTTAMADEVLRAKVRGTLVLDELFRDAALDFFVMFSSITAILGEAGRVDYCAANAFQDAIAQQWRSSRGWRAIAINWPSWAGFGMAARWEEAKAGRTAARLQRASAAPQLQPAGSDGDDAVYDVLVDPAEDWIVSTHLLFGTPTMVGTGFLDLMARYALLRNGSPSVVLEETQFVSPLMFEAGAPRRLRLFVRESDGRHRFSFRSQKLSGGSWHVHFRGEARLAEVSVAAPVDMEALDRRVPGPVDRGPFYRPKPGDETPFLALGPRWETLNGIRGGGGEWLARIDLPAEFAGDTALYPFHPAMVDVALAAAVKDAVDDAYLPAGYRRVQINRPLPASFVSYIRRTGDGARDAETIAFDIALLAPDGQELASVRGYTLKRVTATGRPAAANDRGRPVEKAEADQVPADSTDVLPQEGIAALARILAAPDLFQVVVSTRDLPHLIDEENDAADKVGRKKAPDKSAPAATHARPSLSTPYEAPANAVEEAIAEVWQGILGIGQIGANDDFTELGGNSLLAVQAVANTADTFAIDLPIEVFFKAPTIRGLSDAVIERLLSLASEDKVEAMLATLDAA